jgi:hypothetical protein
MARNRHGKLNAFAHTSLHCVLEHWRPGTDPHLAKNDITALRRKDRNALARVAQHAGHHGFDFVA